MKPRQGTPAKRRKRHSHGISQEVAARRGRPRRRIERVEARQVHPAPPLGGAIPLRMADRRGKPAAAERAAAPVNHFRADVVPRVAALPSTAVIIAVIACLAPAMGSLAPSGPEPSRAPPGPGPSSRPIHFRRTVNASNVDFLTLLTDASTSAATCRSLWRGRSAILVLHPSRWSRCTYRSCPA